MRSAAPLALLALAACSSRGDEIFGASAAAVRSPEKVEAFRIRTPERPPTTDFRTWAVQAGPVEVDPAAAKELAGLLFDDASYVPKDAPRKACIPMPGVKLVFTRGSASAALFICFECQELFGPSGRADFDPSAARFAAVAKKLFPDDPAIQALRP